VRLDQIEELVGFAALGGGVATLIDRPDLVAALMTELDDMPAELADDVRRLHEAQELAAATGRSIVVVDASV
jgi:hypothetical protein